MPESGVVIRLLAQQQQHHHIQKNIQSLFKCTLANALSLSLFRYVTLFPQYLSLWHRPGRMSPLAPTPLAYIYAARILVGSSFFALFCASLSGAHRSRSLAVRIRSHRNALSRSRAARARSLLRVFWRDGCVGQGASGVCACLRRLPHSSSSSSSSSSPFAC